MISFLIAFILTVVGVNGECFYRHSVNKSLTLHEVARRDVSALVGLIAPNDASLNTIDKCVTYCNGQPWCFAVSEGPGEPTGPTPCQFHTDVAALGFGVPDHFDCAFNVNFNCDLDTTSMLDLGDRVFMFNAFGNFGSSLSDIIIPSEILSDPKDGICRVLKSSRNENAHLTNTSFSYSNYYGTKPTVPDAWSFHKPGDAADKGVTEGNPAFFADNGANTASLGFPIRSVALWEVDINEKSPRYNFTDDERFTYLRHEYIHSPQCVDQSPNTKSYIDREAKKSDDTFFHIKDHITNKFFNCRLDRDEHKNGCTWDDAPAVVWSFGEFKVHINAQVDQIAGADNSLIAHTVDTKEEIGWLRADLPDVDNGQHFTTMGLIAAGGAGPDTPNQAPLFGTDNWNFFISPNLNGMDGARKGTPVMQGTSLCFTMKFSQLVLFCIRQQSPGVNNIADAVWINADTTLMADIVPNRTEALLHESSTAGVNYYRNFGDLGDGPNSVNTVIPVNVNDKFDGHMYAIYSDTNKALRLHCTVSETCNWVKAGTTNQLFKFSTNGQSPSTDPKSKFTFRNFGPNRNGEVAVYEKEGAFYNNLGLLFFSKTLGVALLPSTKMSLGSGIKKHDKTMCALLVDGVFCLDGGPAYKEGDEIKFVTDPKVISDMPGDPPLVGHTIVFEPQVDSLVVSDDNYKWVTDGSATCPAGYYIHQVRCTDHKRCGAVEVGCKKDNTNCKVTSTGPGVVVNLEHSLFKACPPNHAVTGINAGARTITCHPLTITHDVHPPASSFPTFTNLGFILEVADIPFNHDNARTKKQWAGPVPLKSFNVFKDDNTITPITYGRKCSLNAADSNAFKNTGSPFKSLTVASDPADAPFTCSINDGFVSFIRCVDATDCSKGIEFDCDEAPKCRYDGDSHVDITDREFCPFGTVITGVSCTSFDDATKPCEKLKFRCRTLVFDASKKPPKPDNPGDDGKGTTKTIIIALATGLPLLIIAAILCLFCIPDTDDTAENRVRESRDSTTENASTGSAVERTSTGVRRRRAIGRKNIY